MKETNLKQKAAFTVGSLLDSKIVEADGTLLGHVADIQLTDDPPYVVIALLRGRWGLLHRLHILNPFTEKRSHSHKPVQVPWEAVERIEHKRIVLKKDYASR